MNNFQSLIQRLRNGDASAAEELHREYGEQLKRIVRVRFTDPGLRRQMDSIDICQSVFADFFVRVSLGQYDISQPEDLLKLLAKMASNRVIHHSLKHKAARRDVRRNKTEAVDELPLADAGASPSRIVASKELMELFLGRLTDEERAISEQRRDGRTWDEIGESLGRSGEAIRKQHERSIGRIAQDLGLDEPA